MLRFISVSTPWQDIRTSFEDMAEISTHVTGQLVPNRFHDGETNHGKARTRSPAESNNAQKVTVVYYLSRSGRLGDPYIIEVPLSSRQGLQLRDVVDTLNLVQGQGMASMYSWSFKRSYRKGFVWQDVLDADFVSPCNGHDYILKGSLLIGAFQSYETTSPSASRALSETNSGSEDSSSSPSMIRRSHSWATFDGPDANKDHNIKGSEQFASEQFASERSDMSVETERVEHEETGAWLSRKETEPSTLKSRPRASQALERPTKAKSATKIGDGMAGNEPSPARQKAYAPLLKMFLSCGSRQLQESPERQYRVTQAGQFTSKLDREAVDCQSSWKEQNR